MSDSGDVLRPLGMVEKLYTARQVLGIHSTVIITATYSSKLQYGEESLRSRLSATIPGLLHRHPILSCYFEDESTPKPIWKKLESVKLEDVLELCDLTQNDSLTTKLQDLHDQQWSTKAKPLWKVVAIKQTDNDSNDTNKISTKIHIAFVYHHVLGDGLSGAAFHISLFHLLQTLPHTPQDLNLIGTIKTPTPIKLIEPIENLTPLPLSWLFLLREAINEYLPRWLIGSPPPIWSGRPIQPVTQLPMRAQIRIIKIPQQDLKLLLTACKTNKISLTSLITATIVTTLATTLPSAPRFIGVTPYTLRQRATSTSFHEIVNQTTGLETEYSTDILNRIRQQLSSSSSPQLSRQTQHINSLIQTSQYFHKTLQSELKNCPHNNKIGLLPYVSDHITYYSKKVGKAREVTWELSNIGVVNFTDNNDLITNNTDADKTTCQKLTNNNKNKSEDTSISSDDDDDEWKIEEILFTQGAQPLGSAFSINCASVPGGPLNLSLTWQEGVVEEDVMVELEKAFIGLPGLFGM